MCIHARGPSITREAESRERLTNEAGSRERLEILITGEVGLEGVHVRRSARQDPEELCAGLVMILIQVFE